MDILLPPLNKARYTGIFKINVTQQYRACFQRFFSFGLSFTVRHLSLEFEISRFFVLVPIQKNQLK